MQLVDKPSMSPAMCAVTLATDDPAGFVDTGNTPPFVDPRIYISHQAVVDCARAFRWPLPTPQAQHAAQETIARLEAETERLAAELATADRDLEAVHTLTRAGYATRRKPGPKPKQKTEA